QREGIPLDVPVTADLHHVTVADALEAILLCHPSGRLIDFAPDGGLVVVTTRKQADAHLITRSYDMRDWPTPLEPSSGKAAAPAQGEPRSLGSPLQPAAPEDARSGIDELVRLVIGSVASDSWRDNGGTTGSIRPIGGFVVVTQTWKNQEQVRTL